MALWSSLTDVLWRGAWGVLPLALVLMILLRVGRLRAETRHAAWLLILAAMLLLPVVGRSRLASDLPVPEIRAAAFDAVQPDSEFCVTKAEKTAKNRKSAKERTLTFETEDQPSTIVEATEYRAGETPDSESLQCESQNSESSQSNKLDGESLHTVDCAAYKTPGKQPSAAGYATNGHPPKPTPPRTVARIGFRESEWLAPTAGSVGRLFTFDYNTRLATAVDQYRNICRDFLTQLGRGTVPIGRAATLDANSSAIPYAQPIQETQNTDFEDSSACQSPKGDAAIPSALSTGKVSATAADSPTNRSPVSIWLASGINAIRQYIAAAEALLSKLPAVPSRIWMWGALISSLLCVLRMLQLHHRLRHASPAPADVERIVRGVARRLGLRRVPAISMSGQRVSPMILCGFRPRLILPTELWNELDDLGRRAVVYHELAHLRRRDHWVRWFDCAMGCLYWWHPLVWWIRARLHEEAEYACDAWVTWLLPGGRRAYAAALLHATRYTNMSPVPVAGIGISSVRARQFARRLTMIMTHRSRPGLSLAGISLLIVAAFAGWAAAPVVSCPPEDDAEEQQTLSQAPIAPAAPAAPAAPEAPAAPVAAVPCAPDVLQPALVRTIPVVAMPPSALAPAVLACPPEETKAQTTTTVLPFARALRAGALNNLAVAQANDDPAGNTRLDRRMAELERQIKRLSEQVAQLHGHQAPAGGAWTVPAIPAQPGTPAHGEHAHAGAAPRAPVIARIFGAGQAPAAEATPAPESGEVTARNYKISKGKLQEFTELMIREDVPIFVTPMDGEIQINATPAQHRIIRAFIEIIDPKPGRTPAADAPGRGAPAPRAAPAPRSSNRQSRGQRSDATGATDLARERRAAADQARREAQELRRGALEMARAARDEAKAHAKATEDMRKNAREAMLQAERARKELEAARRAGEKSDKSRAAIERTQAELMRDAVAMAQNAERQARDLAASAETMQHRIHELGEKAIKLGASQNSHAGAHAEKLHEILQKSADAAKSASGRAVSDSLRRVAESLAKSEDVSWNDAVKQLRDSITTDATDQVAPLLETISDEIEAAFDDAAEAAETVEAADEAADESVDVDVEPAMPAGGAR